MKHVITILFVAIFITACSSIAPAPTATAVPATPTETPIPTPTPIEVAPGEFLPPSQIVGYEARDTSGKLLYIQDIQGNWIKATHEVVVPPATEADWTNINERLGADFAINDDGTIAGVDGVIVDKENGKITFDFDGKGIENYSIGNMKTQEIDGEKRLLVAGYSWNAETKAWEVFNPGFPMEDPRLLGWFNEADVANGNWLRFHQRALEVLAKQNGFENVDAYMEYVFESALRPTQWKKLERNTYITSYIDDPMHFISLWFENPQLVEAFNKGEDYYLTKDQLPFRGGVSNAYRYDLDAYTPSIDLLNGDGSTTPLSTLVDRALIWEQKTKDNVAMLAEACGVDIKTIEEKTGLKKNQADISYYEYIIWPILFLFKDNKAILLSSEKDAQVLEDQISMSRKIATIRGNKITREAAFETWGAYFTIAKAIQIWEKYDND